MFFLAVSALGSEAAYLLICTAIYWCWSRRLGVLLLQALLVSVIINRFLKNLFMMERPPSDFWLVEYRPSGFGFPSGHAMAAATFYPLLFFQRRELIFLTAAIAIPSLMALSRVYLGVHYLGDVLGGLVFGLAVAVLYRAANPHIEGERLGFFLIGFAAASTLAGLVMNNPSPAPLGAALIALITGINILKGHELFSDTKNNKIRLRRFLIGALISSPPAYLTQVLGGWLAVLMYGVVVFVAMYAAPKVFRVLER